MKPGWGVKFSQVNIPRGRDGLHTAPVCLPPPAPGDKPFKGLRHTGMGLWAGSCSSHPPAWQHPQPAGKVLGEAWRTLQLQGKCRSWVHRVQRDPAEGMDQGKPNQQHISVAIWGSEPFREEKKGVEEPKPRSWSCRLSQPCRPHEVEGTQSSPLPCLQP